MPPDPDTSAPAAAPGIDVNALLQQLLGGGTTPPPPQVQNVNLAATRPTSLGGILGEALAGGPPTDVPLTAAQRDAAGRRALLSASIGMMNVGPFASIGQGIGAGLSGAMASQAYSEAVEAERQTAAQDWQTKQQALQLERLKEAIPLLRMQAAAGIPNPLLGGNAPPGAVPPTASVGATSNAADFTSKFTPIAQTIANKTGLPLSYVLSQAGLETGWGSSAGARNNNFFGITDPATGKLMSFATPEAGAQAYIDLMASDRYKNVPRTGTPQQIGDAMALAGYDPNVPKKDSTDSYGARIGAFAGALPKPGTTVAAAGPPGASTGPPGQPPVQVGGAAPLPPGVPAGAAAKPYAGGGIGAVLNPVAVKGSPIPAGKLQTTGKPPGQADADTILGGMKLADTTLPPGTVAAAGPAAGTPSQATTPTPEAGWGAKIGYGAYDSGPTKAPAAVTPAPPPATTTPPAQPTPQVTTQATQPPTPPGRLTFEQWQAQHPITIDPTTYTVTPPNLAALEAAKDAAAQQLSLARAGISGDPNKSLQDYKDATAAIVQAQQEAQTKSLELQQKARQNAIDTQRQLYNDEMQRQQAVEENEKNRQADIRKAELQAGYTMAQKQADADITVGQEAVKNAADNASEARKVMSVLQSIDLNNLPTGAVAAFMNNHPDAAAWLRIGGLTDPEQAGAAQMLNAARSYLSLILKPVGTGALRNQEMSNLMSFTPSMLQDPATRQEMLGRLMALNRRAIDEYNFTSNYFGRTDPQTGQQLYNVRGLGAAMDAPPTYDADGNKTGGGLGPLLPEPPPLDAPRAAHEAYQKYVQKNVAPGLPYVTYAPQMDKATNAPLKDQNGNIVLQRTTKVRPQ